MLSGHQDSQKQMETADRTRCCFILKNALLIMLILLMILMTAAPVSATTLLNPTGAGSPPVDAEAYVLYDTQSGAFLVGKNQDAPLPPASITKVLTVLLAMEKLKLTDTLTITKDMYCTIPNDYTRLGLKEGEEITVEEALYACLLISANDAAMALAFKISGTAENFAGLMNQRAKELGCTNTNFTNPYGLSDDDHLTTARDMAIITAEALKHEDYVRISTTRHYTLRATNLNPETRGMTNGNKFVTSSSYAYEGYIGGKTGYTDLSGYTIVAGARKDGRTLTAVILDASASNIRYKNLADLFDYGFSAFTTQAVDPAEYAGLRDQAAAQLASEIETSGYNLEISGMAFKLIEYVTTTTAKDAGGHTCSIGEREPALRTDQPDQVLSYPLYRTYADGTKMKIGTLEISVSELKPPETTATPTATSPDRPKTEGGVTVIKVILSLILGAITLFGLMLLWAMIRRDIRRRRRRKKIRMI